MSSSAPLSTNFFQAEFLRLMQSYSEALFGLAVLDRDLRYVVLNEGMATIDGKPVEQHIGRTVQEFDPSIAAVMEPIFRHAMEEGSALRDVETRWNGAAEDDDSACRYWLVSSYPLKSSDGITRGTGVVVRDITEQKQREIAQEERLKFEALLSALSAEFINMDVGGCPGCPGAQAGARFSRL